MARYTKLRYIGTKRTYRQKEQKIKRFWIEHSMKEQRTKTQFAICVRNEDYEASPELRKIYQVIPDATAEGHGYLRVVDESGQDYLYPEDYFAQIELPQDVEEALLVIS